MSAGAKKIFGAMQAIGAGVSSVSRISFGTVTSLDPLVITREGENTRTPLTEGFLILSRLCKPMKITDERFGELTLWDGLSQGEKVVLLSFDDGQKFFVERIEFGGQS